MRGHTTFSAECFVLLDIADDKMKNKAIIIMDSDKQGCVQTVCDTTTK